MGIDLAALKQRAHNGRALDRLQEPMKAYQTRFGTDAIARPN
jgi:hypothetical protein